MTNELPRIFYFDIDASGSYGELPIKTCPVCGRPGAMEPAFGSSFTFTHALERGWFELRPYAQCVAVVTGESRM